MLQETPPKPNVHQEQDLGIEIDATYVIPTRAAEQPNTGTIKDTFNRYASPESKESLRKESLKLDEQCNETVDEIVKSKTIITDIPLALEPLAAVLDSTMKTSVAFFENMAINTQINLEKSKTLAVKWEGHIKAYDKFLKNLKPIWGSTFFKVGSFIAIAGIFAFQMGMARKIPDFISGIISLLPTPSPIPPKIIRESLPEGSAISTIDIVSQHPLACASIVGFTITTVITLRLCMYGLRLLRILPK